MIPGILRLPSRVLSRLTPILIQLLPFVLRPPNSRSQQSSSLLHVLLVPYRPFLIQAKVNQVPRKLLARVACLFCHGIARYSSSPLDFTVHFQLVTTITASALLFSRFPPVRPGL